MHNNNKKNSALDNGLNQGQAQEIDGGLNQGQAQENSSGLTQEPVQEKAIYAVDFSGSGPDDNRLRLQLFSRRLSQLHILCAAGLLLSFFYGAGIIFSVPGFLMSVYYYKKSKERPFIYCIAMGGLGAIVSLIYILILAFL